MVRTELIKLFVSLFMIILMNIFFIFRSSWRKISYWIIGAVTVMVNNPIDVIKTKTQASNSSILSATKAIIINDGILGFWRGGLVRSTRMAPLYGLTSSFMIILEINYIF